MMYMQSSYERTARRLLSKQTKIRKPFGYFDGTKFQVGQQSLHKTAASRTWRTFWRLKSRIFWSLQRCKLNKHD